LCECVLKSHSFTAFRGGAGKGVPRFIRVHEEIRMPKKKSESVPTAVEPFYAAIVSLTDAVANSI